jgi:hypothetical protein
VRGVGQGGAMDAVTFTRASNATFVKPDGTLSKFANALNANLIAFPEDFSNAAWAKVNLSVTANSTNAPDGIITADTLTPNTVNADHFVRYAITTLASTNYTFSCYVKANGYNYVRVEVISVTSPFELYEIDVEHFGSIKKRIAELEIKIKSFDPKIWKDYNGIEPLEEMKQFKAID